MDAVGTCDMLINSVKSSNLNYYLNETPFQVTITIKKTYVQRYNTKESSNNIQDPLSIFSQLEGQEKMGQTPTLTSSTLTPTKPDCVKDEFIQPVGQRKWQSLYSGKWERTPLWIPPPHTSDLGAPNLEVPPVNPQELGAASKVNRIAPDYLAYNAQLKVKPEVTPTEQAKPDLSTPGPSPATSATPTATSAKSPAPSASSPKNKAAKADKAQGKKEKAQAKKQAKLGAISKVETEGAKVKQEQSVPLSEAYPQVNPADIERTRREVMKARTSGKARSPGYPLWFGELGDQDDHQLTPRPTQPHPPAQAPTTAQHTNITATLSTTTPSTATLPTATSSTTMPAPAASLHDQIIKRIKSSKAGTMGRERGRRQ